MLKIIHFTAEGTEHLAVRTINSPSPLFAKEGVVPKAFGRALSRLDCDGTLLINFLFLTLLFSVTSASLR